MENDQLRIIISFVVGVILTVVCIEVFHLATIDYQSEAIDNGYAEYWTPDNTKDDCVFRWKTLAELRVETVGEFIPVEIEKEGSQINAKR